MRLIVLAFALIGWCHTSYAQVDPVYVPPSTPSPTEQAIGLTRDLYAQLLLVEDPNSIASTLAQLLRRGGKPCTGVTDFQIIFRQGTEQRLKIKCPGLQHYGMVIRQGGSIQLFGGDGMVGDFNAGAGIIHSSNNVPRLITETKPAASKTSKNGNLPGLLQGGDPDNIPAWLVTLVIVNGFIVGALLLSFFWFMRAKTTPARPQKQMKTLGRSSIEKDAMIIESREILPDIYRHPDGVFIARGRRGKRRLFGNLFFAILYRDYGWKLREVQ